MAQNPTFDPAKPNPDPNALSDPRDEAAVKVDDPGGSHAAGYAADRKPAKLPPGAAEPYPLEGSPKLPEEES